MGSKRKYKSIEFNNMDRLQKPDPNFGLFCLSNRRTLRSKRAKLPLVTKAGGRREDWPVSVSMPAILTLRAADAGRLP